jgi:hypothetical protein
MRSAKSPECVLCGKLLGKAVPPHQNAAVIGALSKRKIRWQNQNRITLNPSSVNFKKSTVAPLIIQGLIILTIQPKSSSFAAATGHLNSSLAFTFVAVQAAANVFQNAANSPNAIDASPKYDNKLQS